MKRSALVPLSLLLLAVSCGPEQVSSPEPSLGSALPPSFPQRGVYHLAPLPDVDTEWIDEASRAEMAILQLKWCYSPNAAFVLEGLKSRNPDIQVIGYLSLLNFPFDWADSTYLDSVLPFYADFVRLVRDDWAYTTTGDTLMIWPGCIFLDPLEGTELNRGLITDIVDLVARYQERTGNAVDGIMHDYFMRFPFIGEHVRDRVDGEIDFDDDGIPIFDDPDEQVRFVQWQREYAGAFRSRFGEDFIQIGNGRLPQEDPELAGMLNGYFYEYFPYNPTVSSDLEGFLALLQNERNGYLSPAKGKTWSILTNEHGEKNNLFCLIASMLAGVHYTEMYDDLVFTGWRFDIDGGAPLGGIEIGTDTNGFMKYMRSFANGDAWISFTKTGWRVEVTYEPAGR
jgi:hypothetical protein